MFGLHYFYCVKRINLFLLFSFLSVTILAQKSVVNPYAVIDKKALQIPDSLTQSTSGIAGFVKANFATEKERSRAVFIWVASNIEYDAANMFAINFYEPQEEKIAKPLRTRKGICENYAALFTDISNKCGIKSYMIEGYTKQNGFTDYIPHAWCATRLDSAWFLFDPTWGSGYMSGGKFYKRISNNYYKVEPAVLVKSHMPFDYLWQFLPYPISNQEFYEGKTEENKSKSLFNYMDSLNVYDKQTHIEQSKSAAARIEKNGLKNAMIFNQLQNMKVEIENDRQSTIVNAYNAAVNDYNESIKCMNDFINYRNKQFIPLQPDSAIRNMLTVTNSKLVLAKSKLSKIKNPDANITTASAQLTRAISDVETQLNEQQDWLKTYFSKGRSGKKSMFYDKKITWFGIPLN